MQLVTARKKIGPVNHPCDRLIDVISIASLFFFGDVTISRSTEEEVRAGENVHVPSNKVPPGGGLAPLRRRGDSMPAQDIANSLVGQRMSQVWPMLPQSGHSPSRSSREPSEPPDPRSRDWCAAGRRSAPLAAIEFLSHQSAIPGENGIGFGEARDLLQSFAT